MRIWINCKDPDTEFMDADPEAEPPDPDPQHFKIVCWRRYPIPKKYLAHCCFVLEKLPRHVEVDDIPDVRNVQTAGRHICRHQHGEIPPLERRDDFVPGI